MYELFDQETIDKINNYNNPYFPIFDFTLHTKNNLSAKKKFK